MSAGLIVNPRSGGVNRKGIRLAEMLAGATDVHGRTLTEFDMLKPILRGFAGHGVTSIFISSGDGTIQAIQTMLAEERIFAAPPRLCLLPHGTTNMTAADLGFRETSLPAQRDFIRAPEARDIRARPTIRAANPGDGRARHGMFLGTGAVWQAVRHTQGAVHRTGLKGGTLAPLATLGAAALKALASKADPADETRIDRPHWMRVRAGGETLTEGGKLMLIVTTLEKLVMGARPFWGGGGGPLRTTIFPYPLPSMVRWLVPLMYGGENRKAPEGAISVSGTGLEIETRCPFVIDGEFFDPPGADPLRIETGPVFDYIRA